MTRIFIGWLLGCRIRFIFMSALPQILKCVVLRGSCEQQQYRSVRGMGILPLLLPMR
jgi:hypothetical protein